MKEIIPKETVAKILITLRGNKLQKEVAAGLNIKVKRYQMYEQGKREMSATILLKVLQYYKINSVDDLLN